MSSKEGEEFCNCVILGTFSVFDALPECFYTLCRPLLNSLTLYPSEQGVVFIVSRSEPIIVNVRVCSATEIRAYSDY